MMKKKPMAPKPRATRRGTPVPMPKMPAKGPVARMTERAVTPKKPGKGPVTRMSEQAIGKSKSTKKTSTPKPKATPKPKITRKPVTDRQLLDVSNMTPAEKAAYLERMKRGYY